MKNTAILLAALAACAAVEGCALPADAKGEPHAEPTYITGSNIARKTHSGEVSIMSAAEYERVRDAINPPIPTRPSGAH